MSAKSLVKWKNGFRVFPKVLGLRENTEPIDMREKPLSGLYLSTVALMWTFCPSRTKAGMPTEPSWKSLQTIPSNLKLRES